MSITFPRPQDICTLIVDSLPSTITADEKAVITATCQNLSGEGLTPNELYNAVLAAIPSIKAFVASIGPETYLKDSFIGYSEIWLPVQYLLFLALISVITIVMIFTGSLPIPFGITIILISAIVLCILAIAEIDSLAAYANNREEEFKTLVTNAWNTYKDDILTNTGLGLAAGSSMTVYSPGGPFDPPGSYGPFPITLDDPDTTYELTEPYAKLTIFRTPTTDTYKVFLYEPNVNSKQMLKPAYPKVCYIVNYGSGPILITNASQTFTYDNNASYPKVNTGTGAYVYPGECRAFVNVSYSMLIPSITYNASISTSNWLLVSS